MEHTKGEMKTTISALENYINRERREAIEVNKESLLAYREAKEVVKQMPDSLPDMNLYLFKKLEDKMWYLETWDLSDEVADELIEQLKVMGIYGIHSKFKGGTSWEYKGSFMAGDIEIVIKVDGGSKPPNCRIEETREWKEIITTKAICEETEEEL